MGWDANGFKTSDTGINWAGYGSGLQGLGSIVGAVASYRASKKLAGIERDKLDYMKARNDKLDKRDDDAHNAFDTALQNVYGNQKKKKKKNPLDMSIDSNVDNTLPTDTTS